MDAHARTAEKYIADQFLYQVLQSCLNPYWCKIQCFINQQTTFPTQYLYGRYLCEFIPTPFSTHPGGKAIGQVVDHNA
jgi:hypothetical protein